MDTAPTPGIGSRIREARIAAGFSRAEHFARKLEIASAQLSKYELGHVEPRAEKLASIARACGVSIDWLITGQGQGPAAGAAA
jgi:transcriptional regulator with XRE-family HTH domain